MLAVAAQAPQHTYLFLTKRVNRMRQFFARLGRLPNNWWIGATAENQEWADRRLDDLLAIDAQVHYLSCEPLLGQLDLTRWLPELQWVIACCESGAGHRSMDLNWVRALRDDCLTAHVPFYFKQMEIAGKIVKKPALDGQVWTQSPDI